MSETLGVSKRIRDLLEARGLLLSGDEERDGKLVGMFPHEISDALGILDSKGRTTVCMLMRQMGVDKMVLPIGPPRGRRYLLIRNPPQGATGRKMSREEFLAKRRGYNEQRRRRKGMLPLEERKRITREQLVAQRAARKVEHERLKAERAAQREAARAARPPRVRTRVQKPKAHVRVQAASPKVREIAPPKAVLPSSEEFVRQNAHDPKKFERLAITACSAPLRKSLEAA